MAAIRSDPAEAVSRPGDTAGDARLGRSSLIRLSALAVLIAATMAAGHLVKAWMDPLAEVRGWVNRASSAGPLLFVVSFLALNTVGVPLPVLGTAAGVAFGPVSGATTSLVAMTITACAQFLLARHLVGRRVRQRLGPALGRVSHLLEQRGVTAVAGARLLPGPFSEFNMLAGLTVLKLRDFTIGTIIGCVPKALAWAGIGALLF
jgi:uncharacterized membrane protein YdjX (TVP38/TMEM64 family)